MNAWGIDCSQPTRMPILSAMSSLLLRDRSRGLTLLLLSGDEPARLRTNVLSLHAKASRRSRALEGEQAKSADRARSTFFYFFVTRTIAVRGGRVTEGPSTSLSERRSCPLAGIPPTAAVEPPRFQATETTSSPSVIT